MSKQMDRRQLLKSGLMGLGALASFPYLSMGAFSGAVPEQLATWYHPLKLIYVKSYGWSTQPTDLNELI